MTHKVINPIHAREGEIVEIHWHVPEGVYHVRVTCPPKATRLAEPRTRDDSPKSPVDNTAEPK